MAAPVSHPIVRGGIPAGTAKGTALANTSRQFAMAGSGYSGDCYRYAADAIDTVAAFLWGSSAYMAANQIAARSEFYEVYGLSNSQLPSLPAGAIIVWR